MTAVDHETATAEQVVQPLDSPAAILRETRWITGEAHQLVGSTDEARRAEFMKRKRALLTAIEHDEPAWTTTDDPASTTTDDPVSTEEESTLRAYIDDAVTITLPSPDDAELITQALRAHAVDVRTASTDAPRFLSHSASRSRLVSMLLEAGTQALRDEADDLEALADLISEQAEPPKDRR
ncbi:hypothetical protein ACI3EY_03670 [Ornithinimicrobium sp. LYQ92]|uniref:hypothetical protein n=1 Tax=Serinicoccus sp. LYQ92 TaxID=3378798 RepID=UPI003852C839